MQFDEVLRTWKEWFGREGVRAWEAPRQVDDVHFIVESAAQPRVLALAEAQGFRTVDAAVTYSIHRRGAVRLAFIYVEAPTPEEIFAAAHDCRASVKPKSAFDAATFELPEPSPEDLAALVRADSRLPMPPEDYLQFLLKVTKDLPPSRTPDGPWPDPFEL